MNIADTNAETMRHILTVRALLLESAHILQIQARLHDVSKLESPEVEVFAENTEKLSTLTYGSDEYKACLEAMKPALEHHYANNPHHPEFWQNEGVLEMDLFGLMEMLVDWYAATMRHANGDIKKSINLNAERFNIPHSLVRVLENTVRTLDESVDIAQLKMSYPIHEVKS